MKSKTRIVMGICVAAAMLLFQPVRGYSADFVGWKTCIGCHEGMEKPFLTGKHSKSFASEKPAAGVGCESCHGAGSDHAGGDTEKINNFKGKAETVTKACLKCHDRVGDMAGFRTSQHSQNDVTCTNCHSIHGKTVSQTAKKSAKLDHYLKNTQTELCVTCHGKLSAQISLPSHHPVKQGKVSCSDCHSPHNNSTLAMDKIGAKCVKCHQEKAGPFRFEHSPVAEDCLTCHTPHGSVNAQLLKLRQPSLCLQCHANTPVAGIASHDTKTATYRKCTNCHVSIHGSNASYKYDQ